MAMTFEQVVETAKQFPAEQQEMLIDLMRAWRTAARRREIAHDAQESLAAFHSGQLEPQSAPAVITELRQAVARWQWRGMIGGRRTASYSRPRIKRRDNFN